MPQQDLGSCALLKLAGVVFSPQAAHAVSDSAWMYAGGLGAGVRPSAKVRQLATNSSDSSFLWKF